MISGNIQYKPLSTSPAGPPGPPFAPTSADNGLSVDPVTGRIVLGNDIGGVLATLLNDREIDVNSFSIRLIDPTGTQSLTQLNGGEIYLSDSTLNLATSLLPGSIGLVSADPTQPATLAIADNLLGIDYLLKNETGIFHIDGIADRLLSIDLTLKNFLLGDISPAGNGTRLEIDDPTESFLLQTTLQRYLFASPQVYGFGELLGAFNGSQIGIDDANQAFDFQSITSGHLFNISGISGNASLGDLDFNTTGFQMFLDYANQHMNVITGAFPGSRLFDLDRVADIYQMGDIDSLSSGLRMELDGPNARARFLTGFAMLDLNQSGGGIYEMGDVDGGFNASKISIDDANQFVSINGGGIMLSLNKSTGVYQIGDIQPDLNGNVFAIDDTNSVFSIGNTAANAGILINGVAGFTGTVTPVVSITVNNGIVTAVS